MKLTTCLLLCCLAGLVRCKSSKPGYINTDGTPDELFGALIARIDQLEENQEAQGRLHETEINKLRHEHETEIGKLRHEHEMDLDVLRHDVARQTVRINELEATVQRQDDTIKAMINAPNDDTTPKERAETNRNNPAPERKQISASLMNRIRRYENEVNVAFFATLSAHTPHIGTNQAVAFDHVVTNIGNSYNPHVGSFVAPVAGTYVFSVTLATYQRDRAHYGIFRNLEQLTVIWVNGPENLSDQTSQTAVLHLAKGDDVTIKHTETDHALYGYNHTMFSGFLLSQDFTDSSPVPVVGK